MSSEGAANTADLTENLPLLEQLEQDPILPAEPATEGPSTESLFNTASSLLANITATSLLPPASRLPELPLLPSISMNSLLLAASTDILSSLTSSLSPSLEPGLNEPPFSTPSQTHTVTQPSANTPTPHAVTHPSANAPAPHTVTQSSVNAPTLHTVTQLSTNAPTPHAVTQSSVNAPTPHAVTQSSVNAPTPHTVNTSNDLLASVQSLIQTGASLANIGTLQSTSNLPSVQTTTNSPLAQSTSNLPLTQSTSNMPSMQSSSNVTLTQSSSTLPSVDNLFGQPSVDRLPSVDSLLAQPSTGSLLAQPSTGSLLAQPSTDSESSIDSLLAQSSVDSLPSVDSLLVDRLPSVDSLLAHVDVQRSASQSSLQSASSQSVSQANQLPQPPVVSAAAQSCAPKQSTQTGSTQLRQLSAPPAQPNTPAVTSVQSAAAQPLVVGLPQQTVAVSSSSTLLPSQQPSVSASLLGQSSVATSLPRSTAVPVSVSQVSKPVQAVLLTKPSSTPPQCVSGAPSITGPPKGAPSITGPSKGAPSISGAPKGAPLITGPPKSAPLITGSTKGAPAITKPPTSVGAPSVPGPPTSTPLPTVVASTSQLIKSSALSQLTVSRPKASVGPARIGQVTAEILTNFQPPPFSKAPLNLTSKPIAQFKSATEPSKVTPPISEAPPTKPVTQPAENKPLPPRVSAGEILASVTGLAESRSVRVGTPSLQANEAMLSDDESSDEEMEVQPSTQDHTLPVAPPPPDLPTSSRSDSPYADDDSFASFLAREVHETALDGSSASRSPTPSHTADVHSLITHLQGQGSTGPGLRRFGVTASCPPAPVQLPDDALSASLDMTSRNFPKRSKYAHRAAMSAMHPYNRTRGGGASVAKTLDLLKAVLQSSFNMEVKRLCDDYLNIFTQAAANIRDNTGDSVPEATLKLLVCKMLEEAQTGYVQGKWEFPYGKLPRSEKLMSPSGSPMSTKKLKLDKLETRYGPPKRIRKPPAERMSDKSAVWKWGMDKRRLDPEKWEPEKMTLNTVFCLGVNVNKALGHAANRGKVYYLHPELFKYACDGDDKTWLYENKYLPVHGGKAFLMIYNEVTALVSTDEAYKDDPDIVDSVAKLQQFRVPQFMIDKMKVFMKSVQGYFAQETSTNGPPAPKS